MVFVKGVDFAQDGRKGGRGERERKRDYLLPRQMKKKNAFLVGRTKSRIRGETGWGLGEWRKIPSSIEICPYSVHPRRSTS